MQTFDHKHILDSININNLFLFFLSLTVKADGSPEKCSTFRRMHVEETAHSTQVWSKQIFPHLCLKCPWSVDIQEMQHTLLRPCLAKGNIDWSELEKGSPHNFTPTAVVCYLCPGRTGSATMLLLWKVCGEWMWHSRPLNVVFLLQRYVYIYRCI